MVVLTLALLMRGFPLMGQSIPDPIGTLRTWADDVWIKVLDRNGGWDGRLSDQGIFQRFNPDEDDEYQLDLHTSLFSPSDDASWALTGLGLRVAAGSITHSHIMQRIDWGERYSISAGWSLEGRYVREHTLDARRDHVRAALLWQPGRSGPWEVGATLGLHFFKPSADVELVAARAWRGPEGERGRVDLRLALLNAFNDLIFNGLGVSPQEVDTHFDYRVQPVALRADGSWTAGDLRFEVRGGATRRSRVRVTFPASGQSAYDLRELVVFAGGLIEAGPAPRTTLAAHATIARGETERFGDSPSGLDISLLEVTKTAGLRARQGLTESTSLEADVAWKLRPETRATDFRSSVPAPTVRRDDHELFGGIALVRRPVSGWTGRVLYAALDRDTGPLMTNASGRNTRVVTEGGYRFAAGFEFTAGLRWDLDGANSPLFDGGQLRFTTGGP